MSEQDTAQIIMRASDVLTKGDFVDNFEKVIKLVLQIQEKQAKAIESLEETHKNLIEHYKQEHSKAFSDLKGQVDALFVKDRLDKMQGEHEEKLRKVDERMSMVKDGAQGPQGLRGKEGRVGPIPSLAVLKLSLKDSMDEFQKEWRDKVQQVLSSRSTVIAGPNANAVQAEDISSQANGDTRSFTVPRHRTALLVLSTQAPFVYRPGAANDFTTANRTLTIATGVEPPASGQTLIFLYVK